MVKLLITCIKKQLGVEKEIIQMQQQFGYLNQSDRLQEVCHGKHLPHSYYCLLSNPCLMWCLLVDVSIG